MFPEKKQEKRKDMPKIASNLWHKKEKNLKSQRFQGKWKRYRVLIDFSGGGSPALQGGFNRVQRGFKFQRGFKVNDSGRAIPMKENTR